MISKEEKYKHEIWLVSQVVRKQEFVQRNCFFKKLPFFIGIYFKNNTAKFVIDNALSKEFVKIVATGYQSVFNPSSFTHSFPSKASFLLIKNPAYIHITLRSKSKGCSTNTPKFCWVHQKTLRKKDE